ncbi:MAG: thioether cross-link-forming SCIFF peptide maturase [Lachnospiraceae bacterium]|nr:thioether cross-link-forming SCIFF peptide maturase [Lachnospiraceae bacterium]
MIHQYKKNGYNIVLDVNSGAVHVVDDLSYDLIEECDNRLKAISKEPSTDVKGISNPFWSLINKEEIVESFCKSDKYSGTDKSEIQEALDEIDELVNDEELFTVDRYENHIEAYKDRENVVKALCLHIAHDCNLACRYCFAGKGEYQGEKELMSFEVGKKAIDFLVANSGVRRNLEVDFFGGEPLMNFEVVKELVSYARSIEEANNKHFRFTLTTNGVLLSDEIMEYLNDNMDNVVLSIDGRPDVHNRMRPFPNGSSSYDLIIDKFVKFAKLRGQEKYYVRGTFTHNNLDFSKDVLHLADLGFKQVSVEPVVAEPSEDYALREEDLPILYKEYESLAKEMVRRCGTDEDFNFFHFMIDLEGGPCVYKRLSGCGSGTEYLAVTPHGDLYPCHQFVGNEDFLMGNVDAGITKTEIRDKFKSCNVYAKKECKDCFAKFYCSGGCAANSYNYAGDILGSYEIGCKLQKERIEDAIMIQAATQ